MNTTNAITDDRGLLDSSWRWPNANRDTVWVVRLWLAAVLAQGI
jgi:hypothetical protein